MNETDATTLLDRLADDVPVGPVPLNRLVDSGQRSRRARHRLQALGAGAAAAAVVVGAFGVHAALGSPSAQPAASGGSTSLGTPRAAGTLPGHVPTAGELAGSWRPVWLDGKAFVQPKPIRKGRPGGPVRVEFTRIQPLAAGGFRVEIDGFDGCNGFGTGISKSPHGPVHDGATVSAAGVLHGDPTITLALCGGQAHYSQLHFVNAIFGNPSRTGQWLRIVGGRLETFGASGHHLMTLTRP